MAIRTKALGPTGPVDVAVSSSVLVAFLRKFAAICGFDEGEIPINGDQVSGGKVERPYTPLDPGRFAVDYLWRELLGKYDDGKSSVGKEASAMEKFREAEVLCGITNARLSRMVGLPVDLAESDIERTMCVARRRIRGILGKFSWDHAARGFGFSTGASTRCPRTRSTVPHKYSGTPETTFSNANLACAAIAVHPAWKRSLTSEVGPMHLSLVRGNRVTTVPKNYKTDRVIAIEPDMNMYIQKGLGSLIRERLRRAGVDLNQQDTNQDLAYYGSVKGSLATIDLSMASDTVATELVRFLLPPQWCEALERCRSTQGVLPSGEVVYYRKFSSMGNGFTFELESLIFYGLALAACDSLGVEEHLVSVYGDDIVAPTSVAPYLLKLLSFCGFKPNDDKTFVEGPFRESCGKHFFAGRDVQPFYIRTEVKLLTDLFLLHNKLYRWQKRQAENDAVDHQKIDELRAWLRSFAPWNWRKPRIPLNFGDGAFIGTFDECTPKLACTLRPGKLGKRDGWEGYVVEVIGQHARVADFHEDGYGYFATFGRKGKRETKFVNRNHAPTLVGRYLQSLSGCGRVDILNPKSTPFEGGVSELPRPRIITMIVDGYC